MTAKMRVVACSGVASCPSTSHAQEGAGTHIRVVTYNVRRFKSTDGSNTVSAIGDALAPLQPTLVALNEVDTRLRPEALNTLADRLGGFTVAFFGHVRGQYGNALLSKYPIKNIRETRLQGGSEVGFPAGTKKLNGDIAKEGELHRIVRGLLECDVEIPATEHSPKKLLTVAVTHLDHISEHQRNTQLSHLLDVLSPIANRTLVVGDLNALTRSDYAEEEWATLEDRAKANGWTLPTSGCLDRLSRAGFIDAFSTCRQDGPLSSRPSADLDPIFTAHVGHPLYRIDYCFVSLAAGLKPVEAIVHRDVELSDHFPVSFDFRVLPMEARL